jgi:ubiquinone/menaquinone biosynthesis C-methylase UbiE
MGARQLVERLRARREQPQTPIAELPAPKPQPRSPQSQWFWDHYDLAATQIAEAFDAEGLSLSGRTVADVGCGDGIMDLGLFDKTRPATLTGFDLNPTDTDYLYGRAREESVDTTPREGLSFARSDVGRLPAEDGAFDYAFSWSAFEHISRPIEVLSEIHRILSPGGAFFLQLWPFYMSAKGSHLWDWFPEDFHHLHRPESEIAAEVLASDLKPEEWTQMMAREFQHLNRITVEELQHAMLASGFVVRRLELLSSPTQLTPELARYSWLDLGVSGIKLIATPG